jgi:GTP-binding protein LepA
VRVERLAAELPRQLYEVAVRATVQPGNRVVASEKIGAVRKNVLAKCYGGDVSRKKKLLAKQKEGKKRMKKIGNVDVPHGVFQSVIDA